MTHGMEDRTGKKLASENKLQLWRWRLLWEKQAILLAATCICTNKTTKHHLTRGLEPSEVLSAKTKKKKNRLMSRSPGSYR